MLTATARRLALSIQYRPIVGLQPAPRNVRTHSKKQVQKIAASITQFGFLVPLLIDGTNQVVAGNGRLQAAKLLKLSEVPTIRLDHLTDAEKRAYAIADNRLGELAGWDRDVLKLELDELMKLDVSFEVEITGFDMAEIDVLMDPVTEPTRLDVADEFDEPAGPAVTKPGDLWLLGDHRVLCADARERASFDLLLGGEMAQMTFTDPPYNVPIGGHVSGLGRVRHREFAMASGEMSQAEFVAFLEKVLGNLAAASIEGAIIYVCMDWRHMEEVITAGKRVYKRLKNLCVWNKDNGGMGAFYRSKHELIFVFKKGDAPHINNFGPGEKGRYRTNVWDYPGVNTLKPRRQVELSMHPTVKPVVLVADAIRDCSKRNGIVLDAFGGSGTTLIAAEKTGRRGYVLEIDPLYVDVTVRRWQKLTGETALHSKTGLDFVKMAASRTTAPVNTAAVRHG